MDNNKETLTLDQLKTLAEMYTAPLREIVGNENQVVRTVDRFVEHVEKWMKARDGD